jgi:hypothetical protein
LNSMYLKLLKIVAITALVVGLIGKAWTFAACEHYAEVLPRVPDPASGRIYELSFHGLVVYQTLGEHLLYWGIYNWSQWIFFFGGAIALVHVWKSGEWENFFRA